MTTTEPQIVVIKQSNDDATIQDSYHLHTLTFTVDKMNTITAPLEFDIDVNMFLVTIHTRREHIGDFWSSHINKDTPIGVVAEDITNGTEIKVDPSSLPFIKPGYYISFDTKTYNKIIAKSTSSFTVKNPTTVTAGTPILITYFLVYNKKIITEGRQTLGNGIIGSFKIPKEYNGGITYVNNSQTVKTVVVDVEITF
jgi:hypothetical protein